MLKNSEADTMEKHRSISNIITYSVIFAPQSATDNADCSTVDVMQNNVTPT